MQSRCRRPHECKGLGRHRPCTQEQMAKYSHLKNDCYIGSLILEALELRQVSLVSFVLNRGLEQDRNILKPNIIN